MEEEKGTVKIINFVNRDDDLENTIEVRCDLALQNNKEYLDLQNHLADAHVNNDVDAFSEISYRMHRIAVRVCYKQAIKDLHNIINQ